MVSKLVTCIVGVILMAIGRKETEAQGNCADCRYYSLMLDTNGDFVKRGSSTLEGVREVVQTLKIVGFQVKTASDACSNTPATACSTNGICTPSEADAEIYECRCKDGNFVQKKFFWAYECEDVNECTDKTDNCNSNADCINNPGSFNCRCSSGFTGDGILSCTDINECDLGAHLCTNAENCNNTVGSYTCYCGVGYAWNGIACSDINECGRGADVCNEGEICNNTEGSYTCYCGQVGYIQNGTSCSDIDECLDDSRNQCDTNAECMNTPGSYSCNCKSNYSGDGYTCVEHPECYIDEDCQDNAGCILYEEKLVCRCKGGYQVQGNQCVGTPVIATSIAASRMESTPAIVSVTPTTKIIPTSKVRLLNHIARLPYVNNWMMRWSKPLRYGDPREIVKCIFNRMHGYLTRYSQRMRWKSQNSFQKGFY